MPETLLFHRVRDQSVTTMVEPTNGSSAPTDS